MHWTASLPCSFPTSSGRRNFITSDRTEIIRAESYVLYFTLFISRVI